MLLYQDFNEQFEGYTQLLWCARAERWGCFIRISMSNLKDIHNCCVWFNYKGIVALSGFQWAIWRIYTTSSSSISTLTLLLYQDFNEQFEGYTQHNQHFLRKKFVALSGFQWAIWRIYTTMWSCIILTTTLLYQDFNEQFEGYTQLLADIDTVE